MELHSFSVSNYRSIISAENIRLSNYTVLVGANNEGKSNILHALAIAMESLANWHRTMRLTTDGRVVRGSRSRVSGVLDQEYVWDIDFPIDKKEKRGSKKTEITLEFKLNEEEVSEFRVQVRSNLNGTLPIIVSFNGENEVDIYVRKPGRGGATLNKKSTRIAYYISKKIYFEYIPSIRTADAANRVISDMVFRELRKLKEHDGYREALELVNNFEEEVLEEFSNSVQGTVCKFLSSVKSVKIQKKFANRIGSFRRDIDVLVDDGQETSLERKGDGVQSLVALAFMRHSTSRKVSNTSSIIAIEEPESHLHPSAIHEIRSVIMELSDQNQIVLTTHSPLFVNPSNLNGTILVTGNKAKMAEHIKDVRDILGVRFSDNLQNARVILLVEGDDDRIALNAILRERNKGTRDALDSGELNIDELSGASGLSQKALFYKSSACQVHCFLDDDQAGKDAWNKAVDRGDLGYNDVNICSIQGKSASELEDLYDPKFYLDKLSAEFGFDKKVFEAIREKGKWSRKMERVFEISGKPWDNTVKNNLKVWMADIAAKQPDKILGNTGPIDNLILALNSKLAGE